LIEQDELFSIIPHRGRMLLLSRVKEYNLKEKTIEAEYHITEDCLFYDSALAGVPAWAGFEFIAQAISAYSGIRNRENGIPQRMGFILSVSSMRIGIPFFNAGSAIRIKTRETERMDLVSTFEGELLLGGAKVMEGKLTVMEIDNEQARSMKEGVYAIK
jgi:predicted hotdog family 3-hydroxylacyl-ACP dehydratase